ncbi:unnamed protein product [Peniophora sp. CBMAI 1063]|nr:unnamed protein product [Peniophora sp. CBMAI 1063]
MGALVLEPKKRRRATTGRSRNNEPTPASTPGPSPAPRSHTETPKPYQQQQQPSGSYRPYKGRETPEAGSSGPNQSQKPSLPESTDGVPNRVVDEDYDEGVAEMLIGRLPR